MKPTTPSEIIVVDGPAPGKVAESKLEKLSRDAFWRSKGVDPQLPLQFDPWPDAMREMPNDYARSALFTVRNKREPRQTMQNSIVFHVEKAVKITFTGIELRADDDELVWQQILEFAKRRPVDEPVVFNLHMLCKEVGWAVNAKSYDRLRLCISRLKANEVKVESERLGRGVSMSLIHSYEFEGANDKGTKYRVFIHPNLLMLFAGKHSTRVEWEKYRELSPIERRLYDYFASHRAPFPLALEKFYRMCDSNCSSERKWRLMVKQACVGLVNKELVRNAWVLNDTIHCER